MLFNRISELRIYRDFGQKELCNYLKIKQPQYSRYELGISVPNVVILIKLSEFYNVSVDYLLGLTDIMKPYPRKKK